MKMFLRKSLPVLCCLALLASLLVPVSAATSTTYHVFLDGEMILDYTTSSDQVDVELIIYSESAGITFDFLDSETYDEGYVNTEYKRFVGLSRYSSEQLDYAAHSSGATYYVPLYSDSPTLYLFSVYEYSVTIDPRGGTWNGSSSGSVFWDIPGSELENIPDPVWPGHSFTGWLLSGAGSIDNISPPTYTFGYGAAVLTATWDSSPGSTYSTIVSVLPDFSYTFPGTSTASPTVTASCYDSTILFSVGNYASTYTHYGEGTLLGFALSESPDVIYIRPGETVGLPGRTGGSSIYSFVPVIDPTTNLSYFTRIRVFNSIGNVKYLDYKVTSLPGQNSPLVDFNVSSHGITIPPSNGSLGDFWQQAGDAFLGFATSPSGPVVYRPGTNYYVGNVPEDTTLNLYAVYDPGYADPTGVDMVSWLATAVGGFLDFELWPGLSLNQLLWVVLVIGILFWFLKITI